MTITLHYLAGTPPLAEIRLTYINEKQTNNKGKEMERYRYRTPRRLRRSANILAAVTDVVRA